MIALPFFNELEKSNNILLAGAGGGYDIFCGLPLYFGLKNQGKQVHLANLSFAFLPPNQERLSPTMLEVTADTPIFGDYFPEKFLCDWFKQERDENVSIFCFERTGVKPLLAAYEALVVHLNIDTIVLIDGGTDSLMRGDEDGLGTPNEDAASITAVSNLNIPRKMMACLGFGVDRFHGVSNELTLQAIAELTQNDGYLGAFSLMSAMQEVQQYQAASEFVFNQMPNHISIVSSSILSAIDGHYGNHHATLRTRGSKLWINPLMTFYWCFQLEAVAKRLQYLDLLQETESYMDVKRRIYQFQNMHTRRNRSDIPN